MLGRVPVHQERDAGLRARVHRRDRAADRHSRDAPDRRRVSAHRERHPRLRRLRRLDRRARLARRGAREGRREIRVRAAELARLQPDPVPDHRAAEDRQFVRRRPLRIDVARRPVVGARVGPCFVMGQAAGTAADLALQRQRRAARASTCARCSGGLAADGANLGPASAPLAPARRRRAMSAPRRKLRSNLEPGTALWAGRRAQWRALGLSDEDMVKPKIAVVNSLVRAVELLQPPRRRSRPTQGRDPRGRRPAVRGPHRGAERLHHQRGRRGALHPSAPRPDRERHRGRRSKARCSTAWSCLSSCDKTTPAQLMAAGRFNIPTILVICGYQPSGEYKGKHVDIEEVFLKSGYVASGGITVEDLTGMADDAVRGPGVCAGMGTANSMHIVCEALGMALPGSAPVAAQQPEDARPRAPGRRADRARWCGRTTSRATSSRAGSVAQRGLRGARAERLDQLREAPAGDRDRGRGRRRRLSAVRGLRRQGPAARGDPAERARAHRGARGRGRRARGAEASRALPRSRRARRDRRAARRRARGRRSRRRARDPHGRRAAVEAAVDRDRARQPPARRRHRAARRHRRAHAEVPGHREHLPFARRSARRRSTAAR